MHSIDYHKKQSRISLIAALGKDRALGRNGQLLWHIPDDLKRFKERTSGHPVVMGRKTWESLPQIYRPLPNRTNIVVTRQTGYEAEGAVVANSLEEARAAATRAPGADDIFVIGGGELYREALPLADQLYLTLVDDTKEADTFFPAYESDFSVTENEIGAGNPPHRFLTLARKVI